MTISRVPPELLNIDLAAGLTAPALAALTAARTDVDQTLSPDVPQDLADLEAAAESYRYGYHGQAPTRVLADLVTNFTTLRPLLTVPQPAPVRARLCRTAGQMAGMTAIVLHDLGSRRRAASPVFGEAWSTGVYLCYDWPFDGERATPQVNADGAAPILVVGGTGDPTTPYPGARRMARALGDGVGVLLTAEEEGHGTYPQNRCVTEAVDTYLRTGRTPAVGTVCRGSMS